jgi:hypothetical protein
MENWSKILNFNANIEIIEESNLPKKKVRIPLTPIKVDANILYYLFELLYPKFINDQQNILDIIISNDGNEILKVILYKTKKAGIHESFQILLNDIIDFQLKYVKNLDDFDEQFSKIQISLIEKTGLRISSIRIFKKKAIDIINKYCENIEEFSIYEFLNRFMDLVQNLFEKDIFYIFPRPNIYKFIKEGINLLNGIKFAKIFEFLDEIFLKFNTAFVLSSEKLILILQIRKLKSHKGKSEIIFNIFTLKDLEIDTEGLSIEEILNVIQNKLKSDNVYYLNQNNLMNLLLDVFELDFPIAKEGIQLLLQKGLFGLRSFENIWYMVPRPKVYKSLIRFFVRLLGININLKKISHWAIPELIFNTLDLYLGLKYKILIILTSLTKKNMKKADYLNYAFEHAFLLEIENRRVVQIIPINNNEIFSDDKINTLEIIRANTSEKYGFVSAVINIDKSLLREVLDNFGSKLSKYKPLSKSKTYKMFKKECYFNIYPKLPPYKLIKDKGMISLFKIVLPILIDKHEF